jgi:type IV pilus assembly protein PilV
MTASVLTRRARRAYTIVELMMSLSVLAIGVSGVIAMQKVTVATNRHAKDLSIATRVAEAWADQLAADASIWTSDKDGNSTRASTTWLQLADPAQTVEWLIPAYSATRAFGPAFSALGAPINPLVSGNLAQFCTHIRFAFLHDEKLPTPGNGVIRAQIRVFWPREDIVEVLPSTYLANLCSVDDGVLNANISAFHIVYLTTAVRQTPQGLLFP